MKNIFNQNNKYKTLILSFKYYFITSVKHKNQKVIDNLDKMMKTLIFVLVLASSSANPRVHCIQDTLTEDIELQRQLNLINKPPIKTIHVFICF